MVVKARKTFCVVAYDISDNKRRLKVVKILEKLGVRINYSVFECMLTRTQLETLQKEIAPLINKKEDTVAYYPICVKCFSKIIYQPTSRYKKAEKIAVIE